MRLSSDVLHELGEDLLPRLKQHLVLLLVDAVISEDFITGTVVEVATETIQVPRLTTPKPKVVAGDGIGKANTCHDGFDDIPREGHVCAVLRHSKLEEDDRCKEISTPDSRYVTLL